MSSRRSRRCTQSIINNAKERKLPVKRCAENQKKSAKCSKTVCDPVANTTTVPVNQTLNTAGQDINKSQPYVRLERLNFDITGLIPSFNLPLGWTKNVEISKLSQKKEKRKEINSVPHIVKEPNGTSSNEKSFKNLELHNSNENHNSCDNNLHDVNSASSLLSDRHEIICTEMKNNDFSSENFKMKPVIENSLCNCDKDCVCVVLDASLVAAAFEHYKSETKRQNLPSSSINTNDLHVDNLSNSNQLSSIAVNSKNEEILSPDLFCITEEEISQSLVESSHETVISELHLGAITECNTTVSDSNTLEIASNSAVKSPVEGKIYPESLRKKFRQKAESLSIDKDADFCNGILDNFQNANDLDLKICDVRGDCSDEVIQYLMDDNEEIKMLINDMSFNSGNENHSIVSNDEQDSFIEQENIEQNCGSKEKVVVVPNSESMQMDSNQHLNSPLNGNTSELNSLTVNDKIIGVFSAGKSDTFDNYVQSPDDEKSGASTDSVHTDINEKISVATGELSQNNVENRTNYCFEYKGASKPSEQNSSSKGYYENDILADDELDYEPSEAMGHDENDMLADKLDYEPSEASDFDMSETESSNGEIQAKQIHSDSKLPVSESPTDNATEAHENQSDSDREKILKDSFTGQLVKDSFSTGQEDELDNTSQLDNTTEYSSDRESLESVQDNDALVTQAAPHSPSNNNDGCELFQSNPQASYDQAGFSNAFVSERVDASLENSPETSDMEFDVISNADNEEEPFQCDKEQEVSCHQKQLPENKVKYSQKRCIDSEDDSESDSEHSFKRKISNENQEFAFNEEENSMDEFNQSKVDSFLGKFEEVLLSIQEKCKNGKIDEALQIAKDYIPISHSSVQKHLFTALFFSLVEAFRDSNSPLTEDLCSDAMKNTMEFFYDLNLYKTEDLDLYDIALCSDIIYNCLSLELTSPYGKQLFAFCQKNGILVDSSTVLSYMDTIKPSEMSLMELVSFLNFISKCEVAPPKFFLKEMWILLFQSEDVSVSEITGICELLCSDCSSEVDKEDIKKFVNLCMEKRFWAQIARLICTWAQKGPLITWVIETASAHLENVGFWYEELAKEIYGPGDSRSLHARFIFGQMGVRLLMEASSKKQYDSAFNILLVLHRYNINYVDYQAPMYSAVSYIKAVPHPTKIFVFPFTVAFTALDVCLHLERPKDAYMIYKSFSLDLPKEFDETLKLEIRSRRFHYLLKITLALQSKDPLNIGIDALRSLLLSTQKDFTLEQLSEYSKDLQVAYNKYMVCILNAGKEDIIKEFYSYSRGSQKDLFTLDSQVLRGLVVFFVKCDMLDEANNLFHLGCLRNIYDFKKPVLKMPPWQMKVSPHWTSEEIKLAFLRFAETLTPTLKSKKKADDFDEWFSVEIWIKNAPRVNYEVDCLNASSPAMKRISSALKDVDFKIQWKLGKNKHSLHLVPESFYNFWFSKFAVSSKPAKMFMVPGNVRVSFGESGSQESSDHSGSSEALNCLMAETYHSGDKRLNEESVLSDNSSFFTVQNVRTVPQNIFGNTHNNKMFGQDIVSKNVTQFSPKRNNLTAQQDVFPHNHNNNNDMLGFDNISPKSNTPVFLSPGRTTSSISPRTKNRISDGGSPYFSPQSPQTPYLSPQKSGSTDQSPQKSFLRSPNTIMSPGSQRKSPQTFSPRKSVISPSGITPSNATSENTNQNCSFGINPNLDDGRISAQNDPTTAEQSPDSNSSQHRTLPESIKTAKPKTFLKSGKKSILAKTTLIRKRHAASCPKYKKVGEKLLKAKSKISALPLDLKSIKITLQNDLAPSEAQRIVEPASGVTSGMQESQEDVMDTEESNFQCTVSEDVFQKITNFLKSKMMVKRKDLSPVQQQKQALSLAQAFIQTNVVVTLDKKTMKLLNDFAGECVG